MMQPTSTPNDPFSVSTSVHDGTAVVIICGEFDLAGVALFWDQVTPVTEGGWVVVDLRGVSFVDSSGLNALLTLRQSVMEARGDLSLRAPADCVRRLLDLAGVADLFTIES